MNRLNFVLGISSIASPPPIPHWLKALSTGRSGKHAAGFSSFDWRKRRVRLAAAVQWGDVSKKVGVSLEYHKTWNSTVNHRLTARVESLRRREREASIGSVMNKWLTVSYLFSEWKGPHFPGLPAQQCGLLVSRAIIDSILTICLPIFLSWPPDFWVTLTMCSHCNNTGRAFTTYPAGQNETVEIKVQSDILV